jgi:hypothetical protein
MAVVAPTQAPAIWAEPSFLAGNLRRLYKLGRHPYRGYLGEPGSQCLLLLSGTEALPSRKAYTKLRS